MRELLAAATLFGTIVTALAFGVMLGYTVILGILRLFGHKRQEARPAATPVLVARTSTSGD